MKQEKKVLVAYFSATGTTARAAGRVASASGADLYEIRPAQPYSTADLNWHDSHSRSSVEMQNPASRPKIDGPAADLAGYDVIFIGYPIWWDAAPRIINSFIEGHDLSGKSLRLFATSGSSGIEGSARALAGSYPKLHFDGQLLMNSAGDAEIGRFVRK